MKFNVGDRVRSLIAREDLGVGKISIVGPLYYKVEFKSCDTYLDESEMELDLLETLADQ